MVYSFGEKYAHLLRDDEARLYALSCCWTHDLIEDTRLTYNDIREALGGPIAEITYALTNEKGRNRKERANEKYYEGIRNTPYATFVKLCDRLANVTYSKQQGSSMLDAYRKDQAFFEEQLLNGRNANYQPMVDEMRELLGLPF